MQASPLCAVLGVDPAPSKPTVIYDGRRFHVVPAEELRRRLRAWPAQRGLLIAWDAPVDFDPAGGFSDRPVDRACRAWVRAQGGRLGRGAVSVLPFSRCPHWALGCHVLGRPFGALAVPVARRPGDVRPGRRCVVEVHPALTLAVWWVAAGVQAPLPRYKGGAQRAREFIRARLRGQRLPAACVASDDHLDAWVAWRTGVLFLRGKARWFGSPTRGGIVLPREAAAVGLALDGGEEEKP